jgi:hypothetical protein
VVLDVEDAALDVEESVFALKTVVGDASGVEALAWRGLGKGH